MSVNKELAQLYNLEGVKEVSVRKIDKEDVAIDLLELKFKVQLLRHDVWLYEMLDLTRYMYIHVHHLKSLL